MNRTTARRLRELEREREALRIVLERERRDLSDLEERRRELEARHREDLEQIARLSQSIDARCVALDARTMGLWAREIEQEMARHADSELASRVSRAREVVESARREQQAVQVQLNTAEAKLRDIMRRDAHNASAIVRHIEGVLASTGDSELAQMQGSNPIETQKIEAERLHRRLQQLGLEVERRALAADIYAREVVKRRTSKPQAEIQAADSEAATLRAQAAKTERRLNAVEAQIAELQTYRPDGERIPAGRRERKFPLGYAVATSWVLGGIVLVLGFRWGSPILIALGMGLSWGVLINWIIQSKLLGAPALLTALAFYVLFLLLMPSLSSPRGASQAIESMQVTQISERETDLRWNGSPRDGFDLSSAIALKMADRVEISWTDGCLRPWQGAECSNPWSIYSALPENEMLFRWREGIFGVYVVQGSLDAPVAKEAWGAGQRRTIVVVKRLPVLLYYNTIVRPGVFHDGRGNRTPVNGHVPPRGALHLRITNHGPGQESRPIPAPRIVSVDIPKVVPTDGTKLPGWVSFEAPARNLRSARFEVVRAVSFPPATIDLNVAGQATGNFGFQVGCPVAQEVTLRLTLVDADGRESTPREVSFSCR